MGDNPLSANLVIGEIVMFHIADRVLDAQGKIDPRKVRTIARLGGDYYCHTSDLFRNEEAGLRQEESGRRKQTRPSRSPADARRCLSALFPRPASPFPSRRLRNRRPPAINQNYSRTRRTECLLLPRLSKDCPCPRHNSPGHTVPDPVPGPFYVADSSARDPRRQ